MIGATFCSGIGAPEIAAPWKAVPVVRWIMERIRASAGEKQGGKIAQSEQKKEAVNGN